MTPRHELPTGGRITATDSWQRPFAGTLPYIGQHRAEDIPRHPWASGPCERHTPDKVCASCFDGAKFDEAPEGCRAEQVEMSDRAADAIADFMLADAELRGAR